MNSLVIDKNSCWKLDQKTCVILRNHSQVPTLVKIGSQSRVHVRGKQEPLRAFSEPLSSNCCSPQCEITVAGCWVCVNLLQNRRDRSVDERSGVKTREMSSSETDVRCEGDSWHEPSMFSDAHVLARQTLQNAQPQTPIISKRYCSSPAVHATQRLRTQHVDANPLGLLAGQATNPSGAS